MGIKIHSVTIEIIQFFRSKNNCINFDPKGHETKGE